MTLVIRIQNNVAHIALNRPEKRNALNLELIKELTESLEKLAANNDVHVVILSGNGDHFCAGADLQWMQQSVTLSEKENTADAQKLAYLLQTLFDFPKPVIAKLHGAVMGGAIGLVACCDLVIAAEDTFMQFTEVKLGLIPAIISPYVIKTIGEKNARRYFLTAEKMDTSTIKTIGLVDEIVIQEQLATKTNEWAENLKKYPLHALTACKKIIREIAHKPRSEWNDFTSQSLAAIRVEKETQRLLKGFTKK